jgi:hypothetical protein
MTRKQVIKRFQELMILKGYAKSTKKTYIIHIQKFLDFFGVQPTYMLEYMIGWIYLPCIYLNKWYNSILRGVANIW